MTRRITSPEEFFQAADQVLGGLDRQKAELDELAVRERASSERKLARAGDVAVLAQTAVSSRVRELLSSHDDDGIDKARELTKRAGDVRDLVTRRFEFLDEHIGDNGDLAFHDQVAAAAVAEGATDEARRLGEVSAMLWQEGQDGQPGSYGF